MGDPVLHLLAGPNGSGKSTFFAEVLGPATGLPWINADVIAATRWPRHEAEHGYEASEAASKERSVAIGLGESFATETVFSHPSKRDLIREARARGYLVSLHIIVIPENLAVARVAQRVEDGGHHVPEGKIRGRFARLWIHLAAAIEIAAEATVYDNSRAARPFLPVAHFSGGRLLGDADWPNWTPPDLLGAGRPG